MTDNPFKGPCYNGHQCYEQTTEDRIRKVSTFDADQCAAALAVPGLQKTVERAIHVRLRKLGKVAA